MFMIITPYLTGVDDRDYVPVNTNETNLSTSGVFHYEFIIMVNDCYKLK